MTVRRFGRSWTDRPIFSKPRFHKSHKKKRKRLTQLNYQQTKIITDKTKTKINQTRLFPSSRSNPKKPSQSPSTERYFTTMSGISTVVNSAGAPSASSTCTTCRIILRKRSRLRPHVWATTCLYQASITRVTITKR